MSDPQSTAPSPVTEPDPPGAGVAVWSASAGFFLITLDILIVNVALAQVTRELGGGTVGQQWVIDGYTLAFASLLLLGGNLSDRAGARRAFGAGVILFGVTSAVCALAPTIGFLIGARAGQGAAAALMLPASLALIREAFPNPARRARALGLWAVGGALAGAAGPLLGGALTTLDWRLVFAVNIPVCLAMLLVLPRIAPSPRRPVPFDWAGQVLGAAGLSGLTFGLIHGGAVGFGAPSVIVALVVAVAGLVGFVTVEARVAHPVLPLELFRSAGMRIALSVGFAFMIGWFGTVFLASLFLQQHLGLPPLQAGLAFLPSAVCSVIGNLVSAPVTNRFGPRVPVVAGQAVMVVGLAGLALTAPLGSPVLVAVLVTFVGAGGSLAMPATTGVVLASVPGALAGTASAVFNTFRQVGGAIAIAVFGALVADRELFVPGMQLSMACAAGVLVATALAGLAIRPVGPA